VTAAVRHRRHYSVAQANAARPWVAHRVERIRAAAEQLQGDAGAAALAALDPAVGGSWPGVQAARALTTLALAMDELERADLVVRDPLRGLVDFPALREGREVYLCWLVDEDRVAHWHEPEAGFAGRRPLEP
jgi:hypothetical protein